MLKLALRNYQRFLAFSDFTWFLNLPQNFSNRIVVSIESSWITSKKFGISSGFSGIDITLEFQFSLVMYLSFFSVFRSFPWKVFVNPEIHLASSRQAIWKLSPEIFCLFYKSEKKLRPYLSFSFIFVLKDTMRLIFANFLRCSRLRPYVSCCICFKFTRVFFCLMFLMDVP